MPKLLLLNPPLSTRERYDAFSGIGNTTPPLGLCYLASFLRREGCPVSILDAATTCIDLETCITKIREYAPTHLGITSSTASLHIAAEVARRTKELSTAVKVIVGGPHLSAVPEETMRMFPQFDFGVAGEGEITMRELLRTIDARLDLKHVSGLVYRDNGNILHTGHRDFIQNLDELPFPAWDLLPDLTTHYSPTLNAYKRWPSTSLVTSRGCPNRCIYCGSFVFGYRFRSHGARYVVNMMQHLKHYYGMRDIYFHDDTFMVDKARVQEICQSMKKESLDMTWACFGRIADVREHDSPLLAGMKNCGCWQISYGVESGSEKILKILKKGITLQQIRESVRTTKRAGISVNGFFILGSPGETPETIEETLQLIQSLNFDTVQFSYFTPFPGTEAYRNAHQHGELQKDWSRFTTWHPVFVPQGLTEQYLLSSSRRALLNFYTNPHHVLRLMLKSRNTRYLAQLLKAARIILTIFKMEKAQKKRVGLIG